MSEPFIGQIMMAGFNFAPRGWAQCNGQLMSIASNTALFSLLGTYYGGDGRVTFGLPDMRGRTPNSTGNGPGLTPRVLGEEYGEENVTLISTEMPMHNHIPMGTTIDANQATPAGNAWGSENTGTLNLYVSGPENAVLNPMAIGLAGGSMPHNNMQPYLVINFCIALQGIFPARN